MSEPESCVDCGHPHAFVNVYGTYEKLTTKCSNLSLSMCPCERYNPASDSTKTSLAFLPAVAGYGK